jgi:hypothetical protein
MAGGSIVCAMNSMVIRARQMSLALLVIAVIDHGHPQADYSGAAPGSSGLMRLGRDLMRLAAGGGSGKDVQQRNHFIGRRDNLRAGLAQ